MSDSLDGLVQRIYDRIKHDLPDAWLGGRQKYLLEQAIRAEVGAVIAPPPDGAEGR